MRNGKKIFLALVLLFLGLLFYASYDIASRTTFPGRKGHLRDRLEDRFRRDEASHELDTLGPSLDSAGLSQ